MQIEKFEIQVNYRIGDPAIVPFTGTRKQAEARAAQIVAMDQIGWIDRVVVKGAEQCR